MSTGALAAIARQRAVLSTIADLIMAAAHGKSLRVAVCYEHRDHAAFADRLTQALLARGRDCRCQPTTHGFAATTDHSGAEGRGGARRIAVISSSLADADDTDVCRISVQVNAAARPPASSGVEGGRDTDEGDSGEYGYDRDCDIVVDYLASTGPVIRHLASWLAPAARR